MKNEIKTLYKKDSKLAEEVARILGYKVRAAKLNKPLVKRVQQSILKAKHLVRDSIDELLAALDESGADLPRDVEKLGLQAMRTLNSLGAALQKL